MNILNQSAQIPMGPYLVLIALFIGWFILMGVIFVLLLKKYPLGENWQKNPHKGETLAIPRGTLRGILTLTLLFSAIVFQIYALVYLEDDAKIAHMISAFEIMLAFYFGSKVMHHLSATDKLKTRDIASAMRSTSTGGDFDEQGSVG